MCTTDREANGATGQVEHVATDSEVLSKENRFFDVVGGREDLIKRTLVVDVLAERVERGSRVGIQEECAQRVVVHDSTKVQDSVAFIVTEAEFPFPGF